jgi:nucleotide-binding universal stress UspA family protein
MQGPSAAERSCGFPALHRQATSDAPRAARIDDDSMLTSILAGVDGLAGGRDALALAALLQRAFGGELVALHAYPPEPMLSRDYTPEFPARVRDDAAALLRRELEHAGVRARDLVVADSSPSHALHRVAEREGIDVIVVGSAHHGRAGRVLAGDVAASTLHHSPCPVAVAPRGFAAAARPLRTIGVAYDGSPEASAALDLARALAQACDARVHIVAVVAPTDVSEPLTEAQALVDAAEAEIGERATGVVLVGRADEQLVGAADELDLLVAGSRGYGPVRRLLLGSTSIALVRAAGCPVLVLPRGAEEHVSEQHPSASPEALRA